MNTQSTLCQIDRLPVDRLFSLSPTLFHSRRAFVFILTVKSAPTSRGKPFPICVLLCALAIASLSSSWRSSFALQAIFRYATWYCVEVASWVAGYLPTTYEISFRVLAPSSQPAMAVVPALLVSLVVWLLNDYSFPGWLWSHAVSGDSSHRDRWPDVFYFAVVTSFK